MKLIACTIAVLFFLSCKNNQQDAKGEWIGGTKEEQLKIIEKHLRGFDMAMIEVDYRYQELFWAGKDNNWDYASYQLDKIKLTIENALQRRPQRANSAENFLQNVLPEMKKSVESKDTAIFITTFKILTLNCNKCHVAEKVPFFTVEPPVQRISSIRK
jgi:hypothetical protein